MKLKTKLLASLAVALVLGMCIIPAWAYFTASDEANGGIQVTVTPSTDIHEWVRGSEKHVVITNDEDATAAVFVRVGVFTSLETKTLEGENWAGPTGTDWTGPAGLGWFEYSDADGLIALEPGQETTEFLVDVEFPTIKSATQPDGTAEVGDNANVIVLYESTPVQYDADGNPYADWSIKANASEGGN